MSIRLIKYQSIQSTLFVLQFKIKSAVMKLRENGYWSIGILSAESSFDRSLVVIYEFKGFPSCRCCCVRYSYFKYAKQFTRYSFPGLVCKYQLNRLWVKVNVDADMTSYQLATSFFHRKRKISPRSYVDDVPTDGPSDFITVISWINFTLICRVLLLIWLI